MDRREFIKKSAMVGAAVAAVGTGAAFGRDEIGPRCPHAIEGGGRVMERHYKHGIEITNESAGHVSTRARDGVGLGILNPGETMIVSWAAAGVFPLEYEVVDLGV